MITPVWVFAILGFAGSLPVHPIGGADLANPDQFAFLDPILKDTEVVSLAESIHMTHEFPLVRLGMVRRLNEKLGFHELVMEGSAADIWIAQDGLLNSPRGVQDARQALGGFFGLWNTREMQRLLEYEAASWRASQPLYITGYDIQPGNGRGSQGGGVFWLLADRLAGYARPPDGFSFPQWVSKIQLLAVGSKYDPSEHASVEEAIHMLEQWVERAAPEIDKRFPNVPHAAALRLIPANLQAVLQFREDLAGPNSQGYQGLRDIHAAGYVLQLRENVAARKLMLWAHVSHLHNDDSRGPASVGAILRRRLGTRLYTIAPLAASGGAILVFPSIIGNEDIGYGRVHGARGDLGQRLGSLSKQDFFLDLRSLPSGASADPAFWTAQPVSLEAFQVPMIPAKQFDGIIWIKTVHAPDFTPFVLIASVMHYRVGLIAIAIGITAAILATPIYLAVRWRSRRRAANNVGDKSPATGVS